MKIFPISDNSRFNSRKKKKRKENSTVFLPIPRICSELKRKRMVSVSRNRKRIETERHRNLRETWRWPILESSPSYVQGDTGDRFFLRFFFRQTFHENHLHFRSDPIFIPVEFDSGIKSRENGSIYISLSVALEREFIPPLILIYERASLEDKLGGWLAARSPPIVEG